MKGIILDSDVLIELLRDRDTHIRSRFESLLAGNSTLFYSAVSAAEIGHGAREGEAASIVGLFSFFRCIGSSCKTGTEAGEILKQYRKSHGIGIGDALIARTAISNGLTLWTRNRKHYPDPRGFNSVIEQFPHS